MNDRRFDYSGYIARALKTAGGHLSIGRGGGTLHFENARLSGFDGDEVKQQAVQAGLPVIDSRRVPFEIAAQLAVHGPMVAVNREPDPAPWHGFSSAPLAVVATAYRHFGADVHNISDCADALRWFADRPLHPLGRLLDEWLAYLLRPEIAASIAMEEDER